MKPKIAIIGGSGFYELLKNPKEVNMITPFGKTSDAIMVGEYEGVSVAFLPRHGRGHILPPHKIPYKANMWALKELGVKYVVAPCACGSLQSDIKPGDFVIIDQFVNRTDGRDDTYFHGPDVMHISSAELYCSHLRQEIYKICKSDKIKTHFGGTAVVINGPRFSSKAESEFYARQGWDVINMTNYPENVLARELEMCYAAICLVTDYDAGLKDDKKVKPVSASEVAKVFAQNNEKIKKVIFTLIQNLDTKKTCGCHEGLKEAKL